MSALSQITSTLSRRRMLMGLAASATAATTATATPQAPEECPELLALAANLDGTAQAHREARARVARIVAQWGPQWPTPADEISNYTSGAPHRDIQGYPVQSIWRRNPDLTEVRPLGTAEYFEASRDRHRAEYLRKMQTKSQRGAEGCKIQSDRAAAAIEPARAYWSEVERITAASGIKDAKADALAAQDALQALVGQILQHRERTLTGLVIKAQALAAWSEAPEFYRILNPNGAAWADQIAASIVRQAGA